MRVLGGGGGQSAFFLPPLPVSLIRPVALSVYQRFPAATTDLYVVNLGLTNRLVQ